MARVSPAIGPCCRPRQISESRRTHSVPDSVDPEHIAEPNTRPSLAQLPLPGWRGISLAVVALICVWLAFGALVDFDADPILDGEFEGMFFTPSDTSPVVVLLLAAWLVYRRWGRLRALPLAAGPAWVWAGLFTLSAAILGWSILDW